MMSTAAAQPEYGGFYKRDVKPGAPGSRPFFGR
jgi:hypothetical protein